MGDLCYNDDLSGGGDFCDGGGLLISLPRRYGLSIGSEKEGTVSFWSFHYARESSSRTLLFVSFLHFFHRGSFAGWSYLVVSTSTLKIDAFLFTNDGGGEMSASSSISTLFYFCVFWWHSSSSFWWRVIIQLSSTKLHLPPTISICGYLARVGKYFRHNFSTVVGKGLMPLRFLI